MRILASTLLLVSGLLAATVSASGNLPDFTPSQYSNGTCYTYVVAHGDTCFSLAGSHGSLTVDDINDYNSNTWGWYGCDDLQAKQAICLSKGTPPRPAPIKNAECGPQVPGTDFSGADGPSDWVKLNPCPLNACCDIWGQCGITEEFCNASTAATGAPETAAEGSNGCISNCETAITNYEAPKSFSKIAYFEASNINRPCLRMNAYTIDPSTYTHVHFAFGNISATDYSVSVAGAEDQFEYFRNLKGMKRIMSFGGWKFSTSPETYMIFRDGVKPENRDTFVANIVDFIESKGLDGVDFDWEYPGEPDIKGIPPGDDDDGINYFLFLYALREALGDKSLSIAAPASYWYLKAFPIDAIAVVVDYIVYMTYDLHGVWDADNQYAQPGCPSGKCLFSPVNMTETVTALGMITQAGVPTNKLMIGVTSYGRSFEMSNPGCIDSSCHWNQVGAPGRCTKTSGYLSNAEINGTLDSNPSAKMVDDKSSLTNILIYNETQWVGYMDDKNKDTRTDLCKALSFAGTSDWAVDLEKFLPFGNSDLGISNLASMPMPDHGDTPSVNHSLPCLSLYPGEFKSNPSKYTDFLNLGVSAIDKMVRSCAAFDNAGAVASLGIDKIVNTFKPKPNGSVNGATFFSGLATALTAGAYYAPNSPTTSVVTGAVNTANSIIGWMGGGSSPFVSADNMTMTLEATMQEYYKLTHSSIVNLTTAVFADPYTLSSKLSGDDLKGPYLYDVANFFHNVQPILPLTGDQFLHIQAHMNSTLQKSLVGIALGAADYYFLKNGAQLDYCTEGQGFKVDGNCYQLAHPGDSCIRSYGYSKIVGSDVHSDITSYGIDIPTMIRSSEACQQKTGVYYGHPQEGIGPIRHKDDIPACFFNVPVLNINDDPSDAPEGGAPKWDSPCALPTKDDDTKVGDYVPETMESWFSAQSQICNCYHNFPGWGCAKRGEDTRCP